MLDPRISVSARAIATRRFRTCTNVKVTSAPWGIRQSTLSACGDGDGSAVREPDVPTGNDQLAGAQAVGDFDARLILDAVLTERRSAREPAAKKNNGSPPLRTKASAGNNTVSVRLSPSMARRRRL